MKKIFKQIWLLSIGLVFVGCSDFLEEFSQDQYYVRTWNDLDELLIGSAYFQHEKAARMCFWGGTHYGQFLHCLTDDYEELPFEYGGSERVPDEHEVNYGYYTWQQRPGINETHTSFAAENGTWTKMYYHINVTNNIIKSLDDVPQNTDEAINGYHKVKGEAHFLRAYYYFFLANLYGKPYDEATAATDLAVPIKLSENVEDVKFGRNTVKEVYDQVLKDLEIAREHLSQVTTTKKSVYRANIVAANLLTSRVYLYMQNWEKAVEYADKVLEVKTRLEDLNTPSNSYFAATTNPETIFSMGGDDAPMMMVYAIKGYTASRELYGLYADDDLRRTKWYWHMGAFSGITKVQLNDNSTWDATEDQQKWYVVRYNEYGLTTREVSSLFWLRTAEAVLIKAEAEAYMGNEDTARKQINDLRAKRYSITAENYKENATGMELVNHIRDERRKELAFEGHRWFDLRRYQVNKVYKESKQIVHEYTLYEERLSKVPTERRRFVLEEYDPAYTLPIPKEVLDFNTGMPNNETTDRQYQILPLTKD